MTRKPRDLTREERLNILQKVKLRERLTDHALAIQYDMTFSRLSRWVKRQKVKCDL